MFKINWKAAIAPTIFITILFFITYHFFGIGNTMIGPFATLSFLRYRSMCNHYECMVKNFTIFGIMAVLSYFAVMNLGLCIAVNALALFWIAYILIDEYNPTNYFPAGMALIFFQISPVYTPTDLGIRLLALLVTFIFMFCFVYIISRIEVKPDRLHNGLKEGFANCRQQLDACRNQDMKALEPLHHQLCDINKQCSQEIYAYNRATLRVRGQINWYCKFILVFQILNYETDTFRMEGHLAQAESLCDSYEDLLLHHRPAADYHRLNFRNNHPDIRNMRFRFALRQIIVITPCLVFAWASGLENAYWLVISVFFMMIPFSEDTMKRVRQRILGSIVGILLCMVLFSIFQGFPARVVIMTIANFMIYGANGYGPTVAYITCSALAMQALNDSVTMILLERLVYTLIGAVIAILANRFIFPIRIRKQISYLVDLIRQLRQEILDLNAHTTPGDHRRRKEIDQRIIKTYLLSKRLETLSGMQTEKEEPFDYEAFLKKHMSVLADFLSAYVRADNENS